MKRLIQADRSVIIAADVDSTAIARRLATATRRVPLISGFKVGIELGLNGLADIVQILRDQHLNPVIIQGGDISECGLAAGRYFHPIVGSAIYGKGEYATNEQMRTAAVQSTSKLAS